MSAAVALKARAYDALAAALAAPVYKDAPPRSAALPFVVITTRTAVDATAGADADGRPTETTLTVRAFAATGAAVDALGAAVVAALTDEADLRARLAPDGIYVISARLDLDTDGPDHDLAADDPLGSRVVRARYLLDS